MSKKCKPPPVPRTGHIGDAGSYQFVLETSPPDYVVEISRYLESTVEQSGPSEKPPGNDSDSGDSLFITQKSVPEAVRSERQSSFRSVLTPPTEPDDDEDDYLQTSHRQVKTKKRGRAFKLPSYKFSFLNERKWNPDVKKNSGLHNSAMAGFFKCVREVWRSKQRGQDLQATFPTMDMDGGYISPIPQHEETSEDEDIRVVEKKRFVFSSKPKSSQPWYTQEKTVSQVEQHRKIEQPRNNTRHETSRRNSDMTSTLSAPSPVEAESNQHVATHGSIGKTDTSKTKTGRKKLLFPQKENEDELCKDSDATLSDLSPEKRGGTPPTVTQPQAHVFHTDELPQTGQEECEPDSQSLLQTDTNNDPLCSETGLQRRKKEKHRGDDQSTEEPAAQHTAQSQNMEVTEVEDTAAGSQATDEAQSHENDWTKESIHDDNMLRQDEMDISETKQKKKKKKKKRERAETEEVQQETESEVRVEEDLVTENEGKKKKKNKKRKRCEEEAVELLKSDEPETEEKKDPNMSSDHTSAEQSEAPQETESSHVKRKKHKKKQQPVSNNDTQAEEDCTDANVCNDDVTLAESTTLSLAKKKKRIAEHNDVSHTEESTTEALVKPDTELVTKKKKKKISSVNNDDAVTQSDDSVSVWKKEKKSTSSFLAADAEGTAAQKHKEKQSEAIHVWHAEKPAVSNGDFTTELAQTAASLEESEEGVRKKKKKKKKKEEREENCEEPNETQINEIQAKIKKKQKKDESVILTETSDAGCQIDEDIVPKKKKKKRKKDTEAAMEETLNTCSSPGRDSSMCSEQVLEHSLETPGIEQKLNLVKDKKKKKKKKQVEDTFTDEMTVQENNEKEKNMLEDDSLMSDKSSSQSLIKNKHTKKKRLYNPNEDFLNAETI